MLKRLLLLLALVFAVAAGVVLGTFHPLWQQPIKILMPQAEIQVALENGQFVPLSQVTDGVIVETDLLVERLHDQNWMMLSVDYPDSLQHYEVLVLRGNEQETWRLQFDRFLRGPAKMLVPVNSRVVLIPCLRNRSVLQVSYNHIGMAELEIPNWGQPLDTEGYLFQVAYDYQFRGVPILGMVPIP